ANNLMIGFEEDLASLRGELSSRKLRLFACASCRRIWHYLRDVRSRAAVEVAERFTDQLAGEADLLAAASEAAQAHAEVAEIANGRGFADVEANALTNAAWAVVYATGPATKLRSMIDYV